MLVLLLQYSIWLNHLNEDRTVVVSAVFCDWMTVYHDFWFCQCSLGTIYLDILIFQKKKCRLLRCCVTQHDVLSSVTHFLLHVPGHHGDKKFSLSSSIVFWQFAVCPENPEVRLIPGSRKHSFSWIICPVDDLHSCRNSIGLQVIIKCLTFLKTESNQFLINQHKFVAPFISLFLSNASSHWQLQLGEVGYTCSYPLLHHILDLDVLT